MRITFSPSYTLCQHYWDILGRINYGDQDGTGETSGYTCYCSLTGDLSSSACVCGCMVNGVSATAAT